MTYVLAVYLAPGLDSHVPRSLFLFAALSQFVYQTFDNLDGKQVRVISTILLLLLISFHLGAPNKIVVAAR